MYLLSDFIVNGEVIHNVVTRIVFLTIDYSATNEGGAIFKTVSSKIRDVTQVDKLGVEHITQMETVVSESGYLQCPVVMNGLDLYHQVYSFLMSQELYQAAMIIEE